MKPSGLKDFLQENALQFGAKLLGMKTVPLPGPPRWIYFFQASHRVGLGEAMLGKTFKDSDAESLAIILDLCRAVLQPEIKSPPWRLHGLPRGAIIWVIPHIKAAR